MRAESLAFIDEMLNNEGINYEFGEWSKDPVPDTYFVGSFIDVENPNEDGMQQSTFTLTGTTKGKWLELIEAKETIEKLYPNDGGLIYYDGSSDFALAIFFDYSRIIPTNVMDIKRVEINLTIKEWKGRY